MINTYFNFLKKGYSIDIYFSTNEMEQKSQKEIINQYRPLKCSFLKNEQNGHLGRNKKILNVIDLCLNNNINYDLVLITRFDLLFKKKFEKSNIDYEKLNLVSILEKKII